MHCRQNETVLKVTQPINSVYWSILILNHIKCGCIAEKVHPAGTAVISADFAGISNFSFSFRAFPVGHIGKSEEEFSRIKLKF